MFTTVVAPHQIWLRFVNLLPPILRSLPIWLRFVELSSAWLTPGLQIGFVPSFSPCTPLPPLPSRCVTLFRDVLATPILSTTCRHTEIQCIFSSLRYPLPSRRPSGVVLTCRDDTDMLTYCAIDFAIYAINNKLGGVTHRFGRRTGMRGTGRDQ